MSRVIVCASPIYGHFAPMRSIAADLVLRGHQVTFLTGSEYRKPVEGIGATFAALEGTADLDFSKLAGSEERLDLPPGLPQLEWDLRNLFIGRIPDQHRSLQRLLAEAGDEPVVVIAENVFMGIGPMMLGAPGLRPAALIGVGVVPLTLTSVDTAPFGMGLPPDSSEEGRARNREANGVMQGQVFGAAQAMYLDVLDGLGADTEKAPFFLDATVLLPDRFLQLAVEELSYKRTDTPESVRFVGTLPSVRPEGVALPEWWSEVAAAEKVVVVTQGTVANSDFSDLIEPTLDALADFPALVIAATGRGGEVRNVPANARVAEFIPFDDLLPLADVLVTNGGFGAVQQSLRSGTPLVVAGTTEDKLEGNARMAATGAAINLAVDRPEAVDIRKAVEAVLATPEYADNARRLAAEYATMDALGAIAQSVEEFAK